MRFCCTISAREAEHHSQTGEDLPLGKGILAESVADASGCEPEYRLWDDLDEEKDIRILTRFKN